MTHEDIAASQFAIVDAAYPFVAAQLLRDDSPRLREALKYMVRTASHSKGGNS